MDSKDTQRSRDHSYLVSPPELKNWTALLVFNLFRLTLGITFVIFGFLQSKPSFLGKDGYLLFSWCTYGYVILAVIGLYCAIKRKPNYDIQSNIPVFFDILVITLIMHLSGGISTGLGLLLIIIAAAQSLLAPMLLAFLGASMATCAILAEQIYHQIVYQDTSFSQAGLLGLAIFVSVFLLTSLKKRMYKMQQLAFTRGLRLATSLKLNTQVVTFMQEGVIVFDSNHDIQLINAAAKRLLTIKPNEQPNHILDLPARFAQALDAWLETQQDEIFQIRKDTAEIRLSGTKLTQDAPDSDYVIFIHDISKDNQKAQHMKLALLGSLAANIAHEIRNPLSSASHAGQLLFESHHLKEDDKKLVTMIIDNCQRMNTVIKNVLNLSKKQQSNPKDLDIVPFLSNFIDSFKPQGFDDMVIEFQPPSTHWHIHIDPNQLHQMLVNLCENGLRYSFRHINLAKLEIKIQANQEDQTLQIHIIDFGPGIDGRDANHMFEPFYTTESNGSGLGLYISREICQIHGGDIRYKPGEDCGSDFYIQLPLVMEAQKYGES